MGSLGTESQDITVLISEDGEVYPLMDIFDGDDDVDDHLYDGIKEYLSKVGRQLGLIYLDHEETVVVIIDADNSVRPFEEVVKESNHQEDHLLDAIRSIAKADGFRVGTAHMPLQEQECSCGCGD